MMYINIPSSSIIICDPRLTIFFFWFSSSAVIFFVGLALISCIFVQWRTEELFSERGVQPKF
ncbi:hypothetical protein Hanom_Chr05g00419491 [Helianthus anomalus]